MASLCVLYNSESDLYKKYIENTVKYKKIYIYYM